MTFTSKQITDRLAFGLRTGNKQILTDTFHPFVSVIFGSHSIPTDGSDTRLIDKLQCEKLYANRCGTVCHKNGDMTVKIETESGQRMSIRFWAREAPK